MRALLRVTLLLGLVPLAFAARAEEAVRLFAAASLTNVLTDLGQRWQQQGHPLPRLATGASSTLAKQVEAGAPADLFASADRRWMDHLDSRGRIQAGSRRELLGNTLVLVVPKHKRFAVEMKPEFDLAAAFSGTLCTGEPDVVPVGIYAKQSLEALGWWKALADRLVGADDVRTALAFVERGECPLGIVYATDAAISDKVEVLAEFPESSHQPIVYPFALVKDGRPEARAYLDFLSTSPEAATVFERYGFRRLGARP